jgi:UrcA family protein
MKQTLLIVLGSALATAALIKSVPAFAEPVPVAQVSVQTADLDLATKAGRSQLDHRLVIAAGEVCGTPSPTDLVGLNNARECRTNVLATARSAGQQLARRDAPVLAAASR